MADYKRMVSYMYQYEKGLKRKNVGYARIEQRSGQIKITLHMQLLGQLDSIFPTYLIQRDDSGLELIYLGDSVLKSQLLDSKHVTEEANVMGSGQNFSKIGGILIFLNEDIFFATEWDDKPVVAKEVMEALKPKSRIVDSGSEEKKLSDNSKEDSLGEELSTNDMASIKDETINNEILVNRDLDSKSNNEFIDDKVVDRENDKEEISVSITKVDKVESSSSIENLDVIDLVENEYLIPKYKLPGGYKYIEAFKNIQTKTDIVQKIIEEALHEEMLQDASVQEETMQDALNQEETILQETVKDKFEREKFFQDELIHNTIIKEFAEQKTEKVLYTDAELDENDELDENNELDENYEQDEYKEDNKKIDNKEELDENDEQDGYDQQVYDEEVDGCQEFNETEEQDEYGEQEDNEEQDSNDNYIKYKEQDNNNQYDKYKKQYSNDRLDDKNEFDDENDMEDVENFDEEIRDELHESIPLQTEESQNAENPSAARIFEHYPRIYPFEDNEITMCVKIEPKDIGYLPMEAWGLSNNSFLLHGFYCYHHLIFAKIVDRYGCRYMIGVPGIYHSREQFMARMFGFDNFKPIRKRELKQGDFGYWYLVLSL